MFWIVSEKFKGSIENDPFRTDVTVQIIWKDFGRNKQQDKLGLRRCKNSQEIQR